MTFTVNIPQPGDNPSQSQGLFLNNFNTLNSVYGVAGDHYPWTDADPSVQGKHASVSLPALPTALHPPGDVLPTPAAGNIAIFAQLVNSITQPYWRRDGLTTNIPLMPIKAFGSYTSAAAAIGTPYNITSAASGGTGVYNLTLLANVVSGVNVSVQATVQDTTRNFATAQVVSYVAGVLNIQVRVTAVTGSGANNGFSVMVLENA